METPATRTTLHRLILLGVVSAAAYLTAHHAVVRVSPLAGVRETLPDQVGSWTGEDMFFCQTMTCQWTYTRSDLGTNTVCQRCQGTLSPGSPVEWSLLPHDTSVIKKLYQQPDRPALVASIVLSGADRTSIHRPQICLVGGGQEIVATHTRRITVPDGRIVRVTVLDLLWRGQTKDGRTVSRERYFAYWFVGPHHETASHWVRMFWMGMERILGGVTHRWAYVNISGPRGDQAPDYLATLDRFIADFYPQVVLPRDPAP
jgi:hypothetical protein